MIINDNPASHDVPQAKKKKASHNVNFKNKKKLKRNLFVVGYQGLSNISISLFLKFCTNCLKGQSK